MNVVKRMTVAVALAAALSIALAAQQPPAAQGPTFKTGTQVVSLFVTVADVTHRLVPGLATPWRCRATVIMDRSRRWNHKLARLTQTLRGVR